MTAIKVKRIYLVLFFAVVVATAGIAVAGDFEGVKEARAVWDITTGDENVFLDRVQLIRETAEGLKKRGIKVDFVLVIHGPASKFVTKSLTGTRFEKDKLAKLDQIQSTMQNLRDGGARIEVCSIAMSRGRIGREMQPFAVIEDNVFENIIVLENKGYAYMPVH